MFLGSYNVCDFEICIVNNTREVIQAASVRSLDDCVLFFSPLETHFTAYQVLYYAFTFSRHLESHGSGAIFCFVCSCFFVRVCGPAPIVEESFAPFLCRFPFLLKFFRSGVVTVGVAGSQ